VKRTAILVAIGALAAAAVAQAAQDAAARPTFEVVSIKKSPPPDGPMMVRAGAREGDSWLADNATLRMLIRQAYGTEYPRDGQIIGGPGWLDTQRFDIIAKMAPGTSADDMREMVRGMLADRFALKVRTDKREMPVYALILAREDGRLGPRMKKLDGDCDDIRARRAKGELPPLDPTARGVARPCFTGTTYSRVTRIESGGMRIAQLVNTLSQVSGRPVIDRTGLTGDFVLTLEFATESGASTPFGPVAPPSVEAVDAPSLFSAIQDQLGLKLESRRDVLDALVIESAEPPSEN